jgi:hypothetical protein
MGIGSSLEAPMGPRWLTFDKMLHELGAVRGQLDAVAGTPLAVAPVAVAAREALDRAVGAVHHCLDDEDDRALVEAWRSIAQAQDSLRQARSLIETAQQGRQQAREVRQRAARQREDARLQRAATAYRTST